MAQHHHQPGAETLDGKLDAADLRRRHDVAGHADDEQLAQPLIEDQLGWHAGICTAQQHGKRNLLHDELAAARLVGGQRDAPQAGDETAVASLKDLEGFVGWNHGEQQTEEDAGRRPGGMNGRRVTNITQSRPGAFRLPALRWVIDSTQPSSRSLQQSIKRNFRISCWKTTIKAKNPTLIN